MLQLSDRSLIINNLAVYAGWEAMSKDIQYAWEKKLTAVIHPANIRRVGLRYINRIERSSAEDTLGISA